MNKYKIIKIIKNPLFWLILPFIFVFLFIEKQYDLNVKYPIKRTRYVFWPSFYKVYFGLKSRTWAIKDKNVLTGDTVFHFFNYFNNKAYQFLNGHYNMTIDNMNDVK